MRNIMPIILRAVAIVVTLFSASALAQFQPQSPTVSASGSFVAGHSVVAKYSTTGSVALQDGGVPAGGGTVTSVGLTMPAIFSVTGTPVTTFGTFAVTAATEAANTVWAGPATGSSATPGFRALVAADLPSGVGTVTVTGGTPTTGHLAAFSGATSIADGGAVGTACAINTGTSGATIPLLSGANTWGGTQTFGTTISSINTQSGTTYTLAATDCGKTLLFTSASAVTLTTLNSLPAGCYLNIEQGGAGAVTVSSGSGATLHSAHSYTKTFAQYSLIGLFVDTNSGGTSADYILYGDGQ